MKNKPGHVAVPIYGALFLLFTTLLIVSILKAVGIPTPAPVHDAQGHSALRSRPHWGDGPPPIDHRTQPFRFVSDAPPEAFATFTKSGDMSQTTAIEVRIPIGCHLTYRSKRIFKWKCDETH